MISDLLMSDLFANVKMCKFETLFGLNRHIRH
jgi:hypothetical protein